MKTDQKRSKMIRKVQESSFFLLPQPAATLHSLSFSLGILSIYSWATCACVTVPDRPNLAFNSTSKRATEGKTSSKVYKKDQF